MSTTIRRNTPAGMKCNPFQPIISEYQDYLRRTSLAETAVRVHAQAAHHLLVWLEHSGTDIQSVDESTIRRFLRHHCRCALSHFVTDQNPAMSSNELVGSFVVFLEDSGRVATPEEFEDNLHLLELFLEQLAKESYAPNSLKPYWYECRHFIVWLHQCRISRNDIDVDVLERFFSHDCICLIPGVARRTVNQGDMSPKQCNRIRRFAVFLVGQCVADGALLSELDLNDGLGEFRQWLRHHRGIGEATIRSHVRTVSLLTAVLGSDPSRYDAELIRSALSNRLAEVSLSSARNVTSSLRMYLRYLTSDGKCRAGLVGIVPTVPHWRLSTLPRYISPKDVERTVASCDTTTPMGLRDRAILLLLSVLAFRAGDVVNLRLKDIDWEHARVHVYGKSKQEAALPLPQVVGDALAAYIVDARPKASEDRVFLRATAPHRRFAGSAAVSQIACKALDRAGIVTSGARGAHVFRHSAATNLLRSGATLETVGCLLRHRSPQTTAIYAKVDLAMLEKVAQPWIEGGAACR